MWQQSCCPPIGRLVQRLVNRVSSTQNKRPGGDGDSDPEEDIEGQGFFIPSKKVYSAHRRLISGQSSVSLDERLWQPHGQPQDDCRSLRRGSLLSNASGQSYWLREDSLGEVEPSLYGDESDLDVAEGELTAVEVVNDSCSEKSASTSEKKRAQVEEPDHFGKLIFRTKLLKDENKLIVYLERACDLPVKGVRKQYDTFVRACLLPGGRNGKCSSTLKGTLNPHFHEELSLSLPRVSVVGQRCSSAKAGASLLRLSLFDYGRQGDHDALGHVLMPFSTLSRSEGKIHCCPLRPESLVPGSRGQLLLSLLYHPTQHRLTIVVMTARFNCKDGDRSGNSGKLCTEKTELSECYAKVTLMCGGQKVKRVRTSPVPASGSAVFNQAFHFVLPVSFVDESSVVITLLERSRLTRDVVLGRVISGPYVHHSGDERLTHWGIMLQRRRSVIQWRRFYL
ncbi:synaptotagmin-7-like [Ornithodoros turicata]|uniref:synaptotagmin-7-like n=1 Tax=Ornithodoros turicata TaxID=34597 RepID=UPI0031389314